ncbi:hypothetical protein ACIQZB_35505 [Streptomyces sp. NPDC097727]|uniref:hypothetical protein n=1 Tax=Streptomyces sp. NPDC097727 TaxID=3366092 RepID=UPI0038295B60
MRTACPAHRGDAHRGRRDTARRARRRGAGGLLAAAHDSALGLPALLLVGDADPLADREALVRTAKSLPCARLSAVRDAHRARLSAFRDAHHDVLNDMQRRSVAAEIVTFLETLRNELVPVGAVDSSAW